MISHGRVLWSTDGKVVLIVVGDDDGDDGCLVEKFSLDDDDLYSLFWYISFCCMWPWFEIPLRLLDTLGSVDFLTVVVVVSIIVHFL